MRLVFALAIASLLGTFAVYTALVGDTTPLIGVADAATGRDAGQAVKLTGTVVRHSGDAGTRRGLEITLRDDDHRSRAIVRVVYHGAVPDAFRDGRHVIVDGRLDRGVFAARTDSLVTKCPSKYVPAKSGSPGT